ncbi:hypothetical protein [Brachybacterium avium]|uniref:hypothetical protein n=1 Tax=Brachybacterium avium TaxID=2017485 RepID=UPI001FEB9511|nr:hypothetical protein [Brachybacterium avium]
MLGEALWAQRGAYDRGASSAAEYWGAVAGAVGIEQLSEDEISEVQRADDRYFLRLDPAARSLIHDLARNQVRLALLSNASESFGAAVRRADWFEAFTLAVISGEERAVKPGREIFEVLLDVLAHETGECRSPRRSSSSMIARRTSTPRRRSASTPICGRATAMSTPRAPSTVR